MTPETLTETLDRITRETDLRVQHAETIRRQVWKALDAGELSELDAVKVLSETILRLWLTAEQ